MRRMLNASLALLAGTAVVLLGPGAHAQTTNLPVLNGVTVTPAVLMAPDEEVTVSVPGFESSVGCRSGFIIAVPEGAGLSAARVLVSGNFDLPDTIPARSFAEGPFASGIYTILVRCTSDLGQTAEYATGQTLTITDAATTTTTTTTTIVTTSSSSTTTTVPASNQGTVDPTTAKPGVDTITIRGGGFKAGAQLQITLGTTPVTAVGTTSATDTGAYASTLKLPAASPPGAQQLIVSGPGPDGVARSTSATITVQDLSCSDFASPKEAQVALGPNGADPHGLDADKDGAACETVSARSTRSGAGSSGGGASSATLPQTGAEHAPLGIMAGLSAMTLGALLVGLSHPAVPAVPARGRHLRRGQHRRPRGGRS